MINRPTFIDQLIYDENLTLSEEALFFWMFDVMSWVLIGFAILTGIFLIINLFLFTKLLNDRFDGNTQHKVFIYQIIWGAVNIVMIGIPYFISGLQDINLYKENKFRGINDYDRVERN